MELKAAIEKDQLIDEGVDENIAELVIKEVGPLGIEFLLKYAHDLADKQTVLIDTRHEFNILKQPKKNYKSIVNLAMINEMRWINEVFLACNKKLEMGGLLLGRAETITEREKRAYARHRRPMADIYYFLDFLFHRVSPKIGGLKTVYFFMTKGKRRVLSRAEILGRLVSCGFKIVEETEIDNKLFFAVKKVEEGTMAENPSYGPLFRMRRVGKNGKIIGVYKMRTMHPYSEYLQEYIYELNSLQEGGKFADDFRISGIGRFFRKFWIDELPMFFNLLKGDMKLVGVRPLSKHYLSLYSEELKELRLKTKPGLVPPYYADLPKTLAEIQDSERRYLESYMRSPFTTDVRYFFKAFYNIIIKKARSN
ncbi:MAG: sugar transferase [Flavobacteriales bacterium]|nr:sugar transferase [Flavobacteriales bacterium]MCB9204533.1 sugar transferase [Flavobacteriales bacterium]